MQALQTIQDYGLLNGVNTVAAAVSGGGDSVALLHFLVSGAADLGISVRCLHVEHGIRGSQSTADMEFTRALCKQLGVPLLVFFADAPALAKRRGLTLEAAAREIRRRCFRRALGTGFCDVVATGHHLSDNAETVLMNILRGSGLRGASGMRRSGGGIIRPLLDTSAGEITGYLRAHGLSYCMDATNADSGFTRNFLRNEVLPLIETRYPGAQRALARFAAVAAQQDGLMDALCAPLLSRDGDAVLLNASAAKQAVTVKQDGLAAQNETTAAADKPEKSAPNSQYNIAAANKKLSQSAQSAQALSSAQHKSEFKPIEQSAQAASLCVQPHIAGNLNLLTYAAKRALEMLGIFEDVEQTHLAALSALTRTGGRLEFPGGVRAAAEHGGIIAFYRPKPPPKSVQFPKNGGSVEFGGVRYTAEIIDADAARARGLPPPAYYADADALPEDCVLRVPQPGDRFRPFGAGGGKSLGDYLTDKKLALRKRAALPCVCEGSKALWLIGLQISGGLAVTKLTQRIICITTEETGI